MEDRSRGGTSHQESTVYTSKMHQVIFFPTKNLMRANEMHCSLCGDYETEIRMRGLAGEEAGGEGGKEREGEKGGWERGRG